MIRHGVLSYAERLYIRWRDRRSLRITTLCTLLTTSPVAMGLSVTHVLPPSSDHESKTSAGFVLGSGLGDRLGSRSIVNCRWKIQSCSVATTGGMRWRTISVPRSSRLVALMV